jgi:predicted phosphodiesterase
MRYAILSDVHGRREKLAEVLKDARARGATQIISLGDVGGDECLGLLRQAGAQAVFGNYEVSGWQRLEPQHRAWVKSWAPLLAEDSFLAVHAAPWWPEELQTVEDFGAWLDRAGRSWRDLFPYLTEDDDYLWQALAELEVAERTILFHGHTHQQAVWQWGSTGRLRGLRGKSVQVKAGYRYVVGVGSVGLPEDGGRAAYAIYDTDAGRIELIRLR